MGLYDDVYAAFAEADVPYVVVGGMAVVLSGHVRATVDLDIIVDLQPVPALRAMRALQSLGMLPRVPIDPADFADPDVRESWIREKHMQVLSFFDPNNLAREVDVFVAHPINFGVLSGAAVPTQVGKHTVPVASLQHLIELKRAADATVSGDCWERATFAGTERAQAEIIADLSADERVALLEQLLEIAESSGALQQAREQKQRALDAVWSSR